MPHRIPGTQSAPEAGEWSSPTSSRPPTPLFLSLEQFLLPSFGDSRSLTLVHLFVLCTRGLLTIKLHGVVVVGHVFPSWDRSVVLLDESGCSGLSILWGHVVILIFVSRWRSPPPIETRPPRPSIPPRYKCLVSTSQKRWTCLNQRCNRSRWTISRSFNPTSSNFFFFKSTWFYLVWWQEEHNLKISTIPEVFILTQSIFYSLLETEITVRFLSTL